MNKKIIPLFMVLPLLASCDVTVKKPSFKKMGEEITFEKFAEEFEKISKENVFFKEDPLPSFVSKFKMISSTAETVKRGKQTLFDEYSGTKTIIKTELDTKNGTSKRMLETNRGKTSKDGGSSSSTVERGKKMFVTQKFEKDGKTYAISVNEKEKYYTLSNESMVTEDTSYESLIEKDATIAEMVVAGLYEVTLFIYNKLSEAEKAEYHFYQNDRVFTVEEKHEEKEEETKTSYTEYYKFQFNFSKTDRYSFLYYSEDSSHSEVVESSEDQIKGDVTDGVNKRSVEFSMTSKKTNVKPVKLTDKFSEYVIDID